MENNRTDKGTFLPGNAGKPKGALNKLNRERKEKIEKVLSIADDLVAEALRNLRPKELLDVWIGLTEYVVPKLQRVNLEVETESTQVTKIIFEVVGEGEVPEELEE
ncbi:MAG: hypothetical protein WCI92_16635 [Bacteroidota bacterium]